MISPSPISNVEGCAGGATSSKSSASTLAVGVGGMGDGTGTSYSRSLPSETLVAIGGVVGCTGAGDSVFVGWKASRISSSEGNQPLAGGGSRPVT